METTQLLLFLHVLAGTVSLLSSPIALFSKKANRWHRKAGKVFVVAMTVVFVTAIVLSTVHWKPFLFMLSFLSYYSVFAGTRILFIRNQQGRVALKWFDWVANAIAFMAGFSFLAWGIYHWLTDGFFMLYLLGIIFGTVTIRVAYVDVKPFVSVPTDKNFWWFYHMGNMLGGTAAAYTAFLTTLNTVLEWNSVYVWVIPLALLGLALPFLNRFYRNKFAKLAK